MHPELHSTNFIPLIKSFMPDSRVLSEIMGFKFSSFHESDDVAPSSLFVIVVLLLEHKLIKLEDIYSWLSPDEAALSEYADEEMQKAKKVLCKMNKLSMKEGEEGEEPLLTLEDTFYGSNQKLGLLEAALVVGSWSVACALLNKVSTDWVMSFSPICNAALNFVHASIEPIYRIHSALPERLTGKQFKRPLVLSPPPATTFDQLKTCAFPLLKMIGPYGFKDPILLQKTIRLSKAILQEELPSGRKHVEPPSDTNSIYYDVLEIIEEYVLPSLAMLESPCAFSEEIWGLMKLLPYNIRFGRYSAWKNNISHPLLIHRKAEQFKKVKRYAKIINKDNVKYMGRVLGKLSHSSPGLLFDYVIYQAQVFELITPVVDSLKFLTSLSQDILVYCLIEALAADKDPFSEDGKSIGRWLKAVTAMVAQIFAKYKSIEIEPMLHFVKNQLKAKKSVFLLVLKEIVQKMSGVEQGDEISTVQLEAMAGGELLRSEAAGFFNQQRNPRKTAQRLKDALVESKLIVPLCSLIAQQLKITVYRETLHVEAKLVQALYDQCVDTFTQFGNFLVTVLSPEEYKNTIPSLEELCEEYGLDLGSASFLYRPVISYSINSTWESTMKANKNFRSMSQSEKDDLYLSITTDIMTPVKQQIQARLPSKVLDEFSPQFLATFWTLSYSDLYVPTGSYSRERERAKKAASDVLHSSDMTEAKRKKESDRLNSLADRLDAEGVKQKEHVERVMARLNHEKQSWFDYGSLNKYKTETVVNILSQCVIPRSLLSEADAAYCAKLLELIHLMKTPNFASLICFDRLFCDITHTINSCSEYECRRFGRFLFMSLQTVMRWHGDKAVYERECVSYPGFVTKFRAGSQSGSDSSSHIDFENYRHVCHKWHHKIFKAILLGIESKMYVAVRNSLIILKSILDQFPVQYPFYVNLEKKVEDLKNREKGKRDDLFTLSQSYLGQLKLRKPFMIREEAFHYKPKVVPKAVPTTDVVTNGHQSPITKKEQEAPALSGTNGKEVTIKKEVKDSKKSDRRDEKDKSTKTEAPKEKRPKGEKGEEGEILPSGPGEGGDQKSSKRRHVLKPSKEGAESPRLKKSKPSQHDDDYEEGMIEEKEEKKRERKREREVEDGGESKRKKDAEGKSSRKTGTTNGADSERRSEKKESRDYDGEKRGHSKSRKSGDKSR
ncbi:THO complex subunit 2-like isoform X2 [Artemia franciscana]